MSGIVHIPFVYAGLMLMSILMLYLAGRSFAKHDYKWTFMSVVGIVFVMLNEGLRFGRGFDYNVYARGFLDYALGYADKHEWLFLQIYKVIYWLGGDWQMMVLFMSCVLIYSYAILGKAYQERAMYVLPCMFLLTYSITENLMRWFLACSLIWIALSIYLRDKGKWAYALGFAIAGCAIHNAVIPIPIIYFFLEKVKRPIMAPLYSTIIFFALVFLFETSWMMRFTGLFNDMIQGMNLISEGRFDSYGSDTEYWLTSGFAGTERSVIKNQRTVTLLWVTIIWAGYRLKTKNPNYTFAYNASWMGFILFPVVAQIELLNRFNFMFVIFAGVVWGYCIEEFLRARYSRFASIIILLVFLNHPRMALMRPFKENPYCYMYVWDKGNREYLDVYKYYMDDHFAKQCNQKFYRQLGF